MDVQRFDALARQLGLGMSRRKLVRLLLGGAGVLTAVVVQKDDARAAGSGEPCGPPDCDTGLTCVGGFCASPCEATCDPCEECWSFAGVGGCLSTCQPGQQCCGGTCLECCLDVHCTPSDLGPCCGARCEQGQCILFSDDDKCVTAGECFTCDGNTGTCAFACGTDQICCNGDCVDDECCDGNVTKCMESGECLDLVCINGACTYDANDDNCADIGECSTKACTAGGSCVYSIDPTVCTGCRYCGDDQFMCIDDCPAGQVCCGEICFNGNCCIDDDCYSPCSRTSCDEQSHTCSGALSLCPPVAPGTYECCPVGPGEDYCYGTADVAEYECCTHEDCWKFVAPQSCQIGYCLNGHCSIELDDSVCAGDQCCCENGSCSEDCCDTNSSCEDDKDCPKESICCAGNCREIECCIDDYPHKNPNDRCPDKCTCFEGQCVDHNQEHCAVCHHDKECGNGDCCCKNGTCSHKCCDKPEKPGVTTPVPIDTLPNTGAGPAEGQTPWIAGAAMTASAAALLGTKIVRESVAPSEDR